MRTKRKRPSSVLLYLIIFFWKKCKFGTMHVILEYSLKPLFDFFSFLQADA